MKYKSLNFYEVIGEAKWISCGKKFHSTMNTTEYKLRFYKILLTIASQINDSSS